MPVEVRADMVILAAALNPAGTRQMAELFQVKTDEYGFIDYETNEPMKTGEGVFYAGSCGFCSGGVWGLCSRKVLQQRLKF